MNSSFAMDLENQEILAKEDDFSEKVNLAKEKALNWVSENSSITSGNKDLTQEQLANEIHEAAKIVQDTYQQKGRQEEESGPDSQPISRDARDWDEIAKKADQIPSLFSKEGLERIRDASCCLGTCLGLTYLVHFFIEEDRPILPTDALRGREDCPMQSLEQSRWDLNHASTIEAGLFSGMCFGISLSSAAVLRCLHPGDKQIQDKQKLD
jgi:hypothetical protein